jgi:hypothetical protein
MEIKVPDRLLGNILSKKLVQCPEALKFSPTQQARPRDKQAKDHKQGHCCYYVLLKPTTNFYCSSATSTLFSNFNRNTSQKKYILTLVSKNM